MPYIWSTLLILNCTEIKMHKNKNPSIKMRRQISLFKPKVENFYIESRISHRSNKNISYSVCNLFIYSTYNIIHELLYFELRCSYRWVAYALPCHASSLPWSRQTVLLLLWLYKGFFLYELTTMFNYSVKSHDYLPVFGQSYCHFLIIITQRSITKQS